jgi:branched-chain amino acid aminotransferase
VTEPLYNVDGELVPASEATVNVRDRGFMYGDAAFETTRVYDRTPFEWNAHADRLRRTAATLGFADAVPPVAELYERTADTLEANDLADAYVKVSVTRGVQPGKLTPDSEVDPTVVVFVSELPRGGVMGERAWDDLARLQTVETRRPADCALPSGAKTHNYLNGILARLELRGTEADEAIMLGPDGHLTEGATSNLFFVVDDVLHTPTEELPLLSGVTRDVVLELADEHAIPVNVGRYEPPLLEEATEVFVTNSTWEIRPVQEVDGREYGRGPVTNELARRFNERVEELYDS